MVGFVVCCPQSVNTTCGRIMIGIIVVVIRQETKYLPDSDPELNSSSLVTSDLKCDYILHILQEDVC